MIVSKSPNLFVLQILSMQNGSHKNQKITRGLCSLYDIRSYKIHKDLYLCSVQKPMTVMNHPCNSLACKIVATYVLPVCLTPFWILR